MRLIDRWRRLRTHPSFRVAPVRTWVRLALWGVICLSRRPIIIDLPRWGARFYLAPRWIGAGATMIFLARERYEPGLAWLERHLPAGAVVVDGGANCGIYTVAASKLAQSGGRVFSFEPGAASFDILQRNIEINHLANVRAFRVALSDRRSTARLFHHGGSANSYSLGANGGSPSAFEEVETSSLEEALGREAVDRVDVIKLDVEGAEELVLRGSASILERDHPSILFEMNAQAAHRFGLTPTGAWDCLRARGYALFQFDDLGRPIPVTAPPADGIGDFLAIWMKQPSETDGSE